MTQGQQALQTAPASETQLHADVVAMARSVWRGFWIIALTVSVTGGLAMVYAFRVAAPQYQATATIDLAQMPRPLGSARVDELTLQSRIAAVMDHETLSRVVVDLDLQNDPAVNRYLAPIKLWSVSELRRRGRQILSGTVEPDVSASQVFEKTVVNLRMKLTVAQVGDSHLINVTARDADPARARVFANAVASTFVALQTEQSQSVIRARAQWLNARIASLQTELSQQEAAIHHMIAQDLVSLGSGIDALTQQILAADRDLSAANHDLAQLYLTNQPTNLRVTAEIQQTQAQINTLTDLRGRLQTQLDQQAQARIALSQVERDAETTRRLLSTALDEQQAVRLMAENIETEQIKIALATNAVYLGPQKLRIMGLSLVLGVAIGLLLIALRDVLSPKVQSINHLGHHTGLPILGLFPTRGGRSRTQTEAALHAALLLHNTGGLPKTILVTECEPRQGGLQVAQMITNALRAAGGTVALVDQTGPAKDDLTADANHHAKQVILCQSILNDPSALALARDADLVILVGRQNHTPLHRVDQAVAWLRPAVADKLVLCLTRRRAGRPGAPWFPVSPPPREHAY